MTWHTTLSVAVMGIYLPIVIFSGASCYLLIVRLLLPAWRQGRLDVKHYAIGISASFALAAHFAENAYYGAGRWFGQFHSLNDQLIYVGAWKVLILFSAVFAVAALNAATSDSANVKRVMGLALITWVIGALLAASI